MVKERVSTGIEGLDDLVYGGLPAGRSYLVAGEPGTGKTLCVIQFLLEGLKKGEPCIYVSIDEQPEHVIADAKSVGFDLQPFLEKGLLHVLDLTPYFDQSKAGNSFAKEQQIVEDIIGFVIKMGAKRLAIDPITPLVFSEQYLPDVTEYVKKLVGSVEKQAGLTTLMTSYIPVGSNRFSQHGIEEFAASGIIVLSLRKINHKYLRTLWVRKMRGTRIDLSEYSYDILPERGLVLRQAV